MLRVYEIKINALEKMDALPAKVENKLHLPLGSVKSFSIVKESIDARHKPDVYKVYTVDVELEEEKFVLRQAEELGIKCEIAKMDPFSNDVNDLAYYGIKRPVVVGFGPCGIFAALILAKAGARPIVIERGSSMEDRVEAVEKFWNEGLFNPLCNAQFGEGGAGTFSDGKLTTGTKSIYQNFVLDRFCKAGANPEIMYKQKPHIGTDVLRQVVVNLRKEIIRLGGEVRFNTQLEDIEIRNGKVTSVVTNKGKIITDNVILALGHSARDTIRHLYDEGISISPKQFSMGVRIEHDQAAVDKSQYGFEPEKYGLGPADYKLNVKTKEDRGVYTFCMCPGGKVINASSHENKVVCNGMSDFARNSGKANSALLCDVYTSDFGSDHPLAGIDFQEKYEELAFKAGGSNYALPKEKLEQFKSKESLLKTCLPDFVYRNLVEAVPMLSVKMKCFDDPNAICYGIESRSSSPVRINRNENGFAMTGEIEINGLYPAGEGAGYAGGIMSAACDGIKTAIKLIYNANEY